MDVADLDRLPLFADLPKGEREKVASLADVVEVSAGRDLVAEGEFAYEFFVIEEGEAEVRRGGERVGTLVAGDFFGEIALLETDRRTATVSATTPMRLMVMHGRDFRAMTSSLPEVAERLRSAIRERL